MKDRPRVRVIIVDDEPPARERIRTLLADEHDVEIVAEAGGGTAAIRTITELEPDLVFLDVQMPGCNGFEVVRATANVAPAIIFVTAFDAHAIQAFDVAAVDYLLKPVVEARFRAAVRRAISRVDDAQSKSLASRIAAALERPSVDGPAQLAVWSDGRAVFVPIQHIDRIEADDDHVRVIAGKNAYTTRETMAKIEARLPSQFVRVHRSFIINRARIREVQHWTKGDYVVVLHDGTKVTTGKTYRERVRALLPG